MQNLFLHAYISQLNIILFYIPVTKLADNFFVVRLMSFMLTTKCVL